MTQRSSEPDSSAAVNTSELATTRSRAQEGAPDRLRLAVTTLYLPSESKIGVGWAAHRLANALVDLGHDVTVFSPCTQPDSARYEHRLVTMSGPLRTFRWALAQRRLDLSSFDGLIAQGDDHLVRRRAVPAHVRTLHGSCFDEARFVQGVKEKVRMLALGVTELVAAIRVREVVGVSRCSLRFYPWLSEVVPNGVDLDQFRPLSHPDGKSPHPTILFVGTYERRKRGRLLQEVFTREVLPLVPEARLWMVCGDAPTVPGIEVLGRLTDDELADRYRRAWVFCLPSTYEGFGIPYAEALVSGTAVVATPNQGAREVLEDGRLGVICRDENLGAELVRLLTDPNARESFEKAGLERRPVYDQLRIAQDYVARIRRQLEPSGAPRR